MLESDFAEGQAGSRTDEPTVDQLDIHAEDSDADTNEDDPAGMKDIDISETGNAVKSTPDSQTSINVLDFDYTTYYAVVRWLYLDSISFAPLRSRYGQYCSTATEQGKPMIPLREWNLANTTHINPIGEESHAVSPKSVYRLAHSQCFAS